jgi:hypothetical protein
MDIQQLHNDIRSSLTLDPLSLTHLPTPAAPNWTLDNSGLLHHHDQIYVPDINNLRLCVLQYKHDHILSNIRGKGRMGESLYRAIFIGKKVNCMQTSINGVM